MQAAELDDLLSNDKRYQYFSTEREAGLTLLAHDYIKKTLPFGFEVDNFTPEKLAKVVKNQEFDGKWAMDIKEDKDTGKHRHYLFFEQEDSAAYIRISI